MISCYMLKGLDGLRSQQYYIIIIYGRNYLICKEYIEAEPNT